MLFKTNCYILDIDYKTLKSKYLIETLDHLSRYKVKMAKRLFGKIKLVEIA